MWGGGAGYFGNLALRISPDFSVVELDAARVPEKSRFRGLHYVRAYAERMPFQNGWFDGVVDSYSLAYTDIAKSIDEMFRVLKPGGKAALLLHSPDSDLVNGSKNNHASLVRHGWDETILLKIEEYLKRTTPAERKKELISEFLQLYHQLIEEGTAEEPGLLDSTAGPMDILANILFDRADRASALVELYRVSFSVWHELFKAADQVPTKQDDVARRFAIAGFVVDRLEVFRHQGFSQGWAIELTKPENSDVRENKNDIEADVLKTTIFNVDRSGLGLKVTLTDLGGKEVARGTLDGKRGAIEFRNLSVDSAESIVTSDLLTGAIKNFFC